MVLLSMGVGIGVSAALFDPATRRAMLLVSIAMSVGVAWWMLRKPGRTLAMTLGLAASVAISIGLVAYSLVAHGW